MMQSDTIISVFLFLLLFLAVSIFFNTITSHKPAQHSLGPSDISGMLISGGFDSGPFPRIGEPVYFEVFNLTDTGIANITLNVHGTNNSIRIYTFPDMKKAEFCVESRNRTNITVFMNATESEYIMYAGSANMSTHCDSLTPEKNLTAGVEFSGAGTVVDVLKLRQADLSGFGIYYNVTISPNASVGNPVPERGAKIISYPFMCVNQTDYYICNITVASW